MPMHGMTHQCQVTYDIKHLMAYEFVVIAQVVERTRISHNDRICKRTTQRKTPLAERLDIFQHTERAGRRDFVDERAPAY